MKRIGIIPARFQSTRFPGKPLVNINGKPMIWHTYQSTIACKSLDEVIVATDDQKIIEVCSNHQIPVEMTDVNHTSGTGRCAEIAQKYRPNDLIVNVQGDEPFISVEHLDSLIHLFEEENTQIGTLIKVITDSIELNNPNRPKVVIDSDHNALLFSRSIIPTLTNTAPEHWVNEHVFYKHIGLYGYRNDVLQKLVKLAPTKLEKAESLEQLRWLSHGYRIKTAITSKESFCVDTPHDLKELLNNLNKSS